MSSSTEMLLKLHLETFVPLLIHEFSSGQRHLRFDRPDLVEIIAAHGDAILYRVPGQTARAVAALTEAVATLAFCPGGVTAFGLHFEADPEELGIRSQELEKPVQALREHLTLIPHSQPLTPPTQEVRDGPH